MNLTAITEKEDVYAKHFKDSLAIFNLEQIKNAKTVIDVGTGAGFPGMVMAIENSEMEITLLDSLKKRLNFLDEVKEKLGLLNVTTVHGRAEDFGKDENYRHKFDVALSRAVAFLPSLCELCMPFVKCGGYFIAFKGPNVNEEVEKSQNAIKLLGGKLEKIVNYEIPGTDLKHNFVLIKKISETSTKYPRKIPKPLKNPIE